jgi:hypothetical protein
VRYILFAILIYVLYQFIVNLIIPVYQTTRKIKKGFEDMNSRMNQQKQQDSSPSSSQGSGPKAKPGDYIDFEEVK